MPCSLLTGEENVPALDARVVSSTIEMVNTRRPIDMAVIDEAQMIFDADRGWAWTQAIVGVPANELIVICSAYAVPAIENLLGLCGERCSVQHFERKQHVQPLPHPVPLDALKHGDAVVAFSRRDVLMLRDQIAADGHPVSVIYGALPPEVRRREAERFAQGRVAHPRGHRCHRHGAEPADPARAVQHHDQVRRRRTTGRSANPRCTRSPAAPAASACTRKASSACCAMPSPRPRARCRSCCASRRARRRDFKAPVAPNWWHVNTIASRLRLMKLREVLGVFMEQLRLDDAHFAVAELEQMLRARRAGSTRPPAACR